MKISINGKQLLKRIENEYQVFELIPSSATRNYNNSLIAKLAASLYRSPAEREKFFTEAAWIEFKDEYKVSFKTYITKDKINFYFVVPEEKAQEFKRKIESTYNREVAIAEIEELPRLDPAKCYCAELSLKKHPIFSLNTDSKETSAPLESILSTVKTLEDGDIALLDVLFTPYNVKGWAIEAQKAHNYLEHGIVPGVVSKKNIWQILDDLLEKVRLGILSWVPATKEEKKKINSYLSTTQKRAMAIKEEMSNSSRKKQNEEVLETNIRVAVQSDDTERARSAGRTLTTAFKDISQDNELEAIETPKAAIIKFIYSIENQKKTSKTNKLSIHECGKLLQLPGKSLQQDYPQINSTIRKEVELSPELQHEEIKHIKLGYVTEKGSKKLACIPLESYPGVDQKDVYDALCSTTFCQGKQGSGKSEGFGTNTAYDMLMAGFSVFAIDSADCQALKKLINQLPEDFPDDHIHAISFDYKSWPVALNWSDIYEKSNSKNEDEELEAIAIAERITKRFLDFINTLSSTGDFTDRMSQYVTSCMRAVTTKKNWSFLDLELSLTSLAYREELLNSSEVQQMPMVARDLLTLQEKAEENKINSIIEPILSRLKTLADSILMENMFFQEPKLDESGEPALNFRRIMDNQEGGYGHLVVVHAGPTWEENQATILGFILDKIGFNIFSRIDTEQKDRKPVLVWVDEPHRFIHRVEKKLSENSVELRKYRGKMLYTAHYISQLGAAAKAMINGGMQITSYKTDDVVDMQRLSHRFAPYNDANELYNSLPDKWKAVNSIRLPSGKNCPAFIAEMVEPPAPVKDRSYIWEQSAKKYGRHWKEVRDSIQQKRQHYQKLDQQLYVQIEAEKEAKKGQRKKTSAM